ncbi:uncharacterized protein [Ptychodera flava]|uniref:uncharacterized protein n=1 Tax=Ptychodera flava TaxID=63121 RepID=UPI00396A1915
MDDHMKHECVELQAAAAEYTEYLNSQLEKVKAKEKTARDRKKRLQDMLKDEDEHYEKEENEIKELMKHTLEMMTTKIEENGKMLLKSVKDVYDSNKEILNAKIKELDFIESDCNSVQEFVEAVKHHGNAKQLMSVRQGLTSRFQELLSVNDSVSRMEPCSVFKFLPSADFMKEGKLGEIATSQFQFKDIPEFVNVGDEVHIKLVTVGQQQKLNVSEEDIQVDVTSSTDETVATMVTRNEDGTFSITWQAATRHYNVSISVLGKPAGTVVVPKKGLLHVFKGDAMMGALESLTGVTMLKNDVIMVCDIMILFVRMNQRNDLTIPVIILSESFLPLYSAVSSKGLIFITSSKEVALINGEDIKYFGKGILIEAVGIAVHPLNSYVYVVDNGAHCVRVFSQDGVYVSCFGHEQLQKPRCICIDNNGNVMVSDEGLNSVELYKADGQFRRSLSRNLSLKHPEGIAIDKYGYVYVCDYGNSRVVKVDSRG